MTSVAGVVCGAVRTYLHGICNHARLLKHGDFAAGSLRAAAACNKIAQNYDPWTHRVSFTPQTPRLVLHLQEKHLEDPQDCWENILQSDETNAELLKGLCPVTAGIKLMADS